MKENMDQLEQILQEEFDRAAREEEDSIQEDDSLVVPEGKMDKLREKINGKIREIEGMDLYACLSEEDQKALELGRRIMEQEVQKELQVKAVRKKRRIQVYVGLAAALVAVLAIGMTSTGGAERIIRMMTQTVGNREIEKITSADDIKLMEKELEEEEEAYQKISEEFGTEPVKIIYRMKTMKFQRMELDHILQTAEIYYGNNDKVMAYFINASYRDTSWGIDVEDEIVYTDLRTVGTCEIEIKGYITSKKKEEKYSAKFKYNGLEYYLVATMSGPEFDSIINNLLFP